MKHFVNIAIGALLVITAPYTVLAHELSGYIEGEVMLFFNDARHRGQEDNSASLAVEPEYYHDWENNLSFVFVPFARIDSADSQRTHFDVRELNFLWVGDNLEFRIGASKVFWGVTEFVHLADIINQTDFVESLDGEEKLGQPMTQLSIPLDLGTFDLFLLPMFRERTFPGADGRLRNAWVVDTDNAEYESGAEQYHLDVAARYSHSIDNIDLGLYYFKGTNREPTLIPNPADQALTPFYQQISQTGMDLQLTTGSWLLKMEAIYRTGQGKSFYAFTNGLEYTITGVADTQADLGIIGEMAYDERQEDATTTYENDIMFGLRLAVNDVASSEILAGLIKDWNDSTTMLTLEANRRIGDNWKLSLEAALLTQVDKDDLLYDLRDDGYIKTNLKYYF